MHSPALGFVDGNDKIVPVVEETTDISTGSETLNENGGTLVLPDKVAKVTVIRDMTPEEVAARSKAIAYEAATAEVKADSFVDIFLDMTPQGVEQYIDGAVTDMASAKQLLKKIGIMLLILARRSLKEG